MEGGRDGWFIGGDKAPERVIARSGRGKWKRKPKAAADKAMASRLFASRPLSW